MHLWQPFRRLCGTARALKARNVRQRVHHSWRDLGLPDPARHDCRRERVKVDKYTCLEPSVKLNSPDHVRIAVERLTLENHELRQMNAILSRSNQDLSGLLSQLATTCRNPCARLRSTQSFWKRNIARSMTRIRDFRGKHRPGRHTHGGSPR